MIKNNLRIKDNISLTDQIMVINDIVAAYFKNGDYTPYYAAMGEIIAVGTYFLDGYELEEGEDIYTLYCTDIEVRRLIDMFINNSNQKSQNLATMKFIRDMVKDKLQFAKERAIHSRVKTENAFESLKEFIDVLTYTLSNFSDSVLSTITPEMIKTTQTVMEKMADSNFQMTSENIAEIIKDAADFDFDTATKEIIDAKNNEIMELKKYKELWESHNTK